MSLSIEITDVIVTGCYSLKYVSYSGLFLTRALSNPYPRYIIGLAVYLPGISSARFCHELSKFEGSKNGDKPNTKNTRNLTICTL